jgi:hypothetical protein
MGRAGVRVAWGGNTVTTDRPNFESVPGLSQDQPLILCVLGAKAWAQCRDWCKNKLTWNMLSRKSKNAIAYVFVIREATMRILIVRATGCAKIRANICDQTTEIVTAMRTAKWTLRGIIEQTFGDQRATFRDPHGTPKGHPRAPRDPWGTPQGPPRPPKGRPRSGKNRRRGIAQIFLCTQAWIFVQS